jgi:hypothetical protein
MELTASDFAKTIGTYRSSYKTTRWSLQIDLNIKGDFTSKPFDPMPFNPNMTINEKDKLVYPSGMIYYVPLVKFYKEDMTTTLNKVAPGSTDYKSLFTSNSRFSSLLQTALNDGSRRPLDGNDFETVSPFINEVNDHNVKLILETFFPTNGRLIIMGQPYVVRSYEFKPVYLRPIFNAKDQPEKVDKAFPFKYYLSLNPFDLCEILFRCFAKLLCSL